MSRLTTPSRQSSGHMVVEPRKVESDVRHFHLRRGDAADYPGLGRLWEAVYGVPRSLDSLRWLYEQNPAGRCELWLAEDGHTKEIIASRPVFPWRMRVGDRELVVREAGDAMTHPEFRGRGIFSALVQASWSALRDQGIPFAFSFSNANSLSVYKKTTVGNGPRAGTHEVLGFRRMVYPLSARLLRKRMSALGGLIARLDLATRAFQRWRLALRDHLSVFPVTRFGAEFDDLWARTAGRHGVLTVRNSRYLNWRFIDTPGGGFRVLGLRSHGELAGYVAFGIDAQGDGSIADLFGPPEPGIIAALLGASLAAMLENGAVKASIWVAQESRAFAVIRSFGFIPRDECFPMAVHVYNDGAEAETALDAQQWWAWYGDRDVQY